MYRCQHNSYEAGERELTSQACEPLRREGSTDEII
jgi:hypothetical protein